MYRVERVALVGAAGLLGSHIFNALYGSKRFALTILTRNSSQHEFHSSATVRIAEIDYEDAASLRLALEGHDALVSVLGKTALHLQPRLIDAAVAAGVRHIIPSEFGMDLLHPLVHEFPTYRPKVQVEELLERHRKQSGTSYTLIFNNCLLDWAVSAQGALLLDPVLRTAFLYDGGNTIFSTTSMATVGRTVVAVLDHYTETANRAVYVQDVAVTQNELLDMAREATVGDGGKEWTVAMLDTAQLESEARANLDNGFIGPSVFYGFATRAAFAKGYGGHFLKLDNALLGIPEMDKREVKSIVRKAVARGS